MQMKITLTPDQKKTLELRHRKVRDVHECDRIKAVLLNSEGWSVLQIAQALRKHESTISRHHASSHCIHIVLDGAGYHRSAAVVERAKELNIKLHYLPPYSPNLNPIERLWKVMNEYARNNKYFATTKEFRHQINHFFDVTLPCIADSLNGRINDNFQVLNSAS